MVQESDNPFIVKEFLLHSQNYHRKTAVVPTSMLFLNAAKIAALENSELKNLRFALKKSDSYLSPLSLNHDSYFLGLFLFSLISDFEVYLTEVIKVAICSYPHKIGSIQFKLSQVLDQSKDEIVLMAAELYMNQLMYKKPKEYLIDVANILSIDLEPFNELWNHFVEAKARRDLGVHNAWRVNQTYIRKVKEIDVDIESKVDMNKLLLPDHEYILKVIETCDLIVNGITDALVIKYRQTGIRSN